MGIVSSPRARTIARLALPIIGGMASQAVLNIVDAAMVGTLGDAALAAVGVGSTVTFAALALVMGLSAAVQASSSRRVGEGRREEATVPLNAALLVAVGAAVGLTPLWVWVAPHVLPWLTRDGDVQALATSYVQIRAVSVAAVGMNFAFRGYWNGVGRAGIYMRSLVFMQLVNIALNWLLIFGALGAPRWGTDGAAVATSAASYAGAAYYFQLTWRHARTEGFLASRPAWAEVRRVLRLGWPAGVQIAFMAVGYTVFYGIVGELGTRATAAAHALITIMLAALLPGMGMGLAAATLVGQAMGRGDLGDARRWAWHVAQVAVVGLGLLGLPMVLAPELLLQGFLRDPETLALAVAPLRLFGAAIGLEAVGTVLQQAIAGAGDTRRAMWLSTVIQWGLYLPGAWLLGPKLGGGLLGVWAAAALNYGVRGAVFAASWERGRWRHSQA